MPAEYRIQRIQVSCGYGDGGDGQRGVDLERVEQVNKICELVYAELSPGDFIFFNCNLLDKSSQNLSEARWWSLICAYNMQENKLVYFNPENDKSIQ